MFKVGDLVVYSSLGICKINDICDETYYGRTRKYYILHPIEDNDLTIRNPVDNDRVLMLGIINRQDAEDMLESFKRTGIAWIEKGNERTKIYHEIVMSGNRKEIAGIVNTLMCRKYEVEMADKKLGEPDRRLLLHIQNILYKELAISLDTTFEKIANEVERNIKYKIGLLLSERVPTK
ncbi:CarD family transcriptional regulator [Bacillus sp. HNG]|uniref:CarD family transcriptional regulator n=1 Tax=Bacillus sp. HNG TaxID=2293325 RepID=UPI000E2FB8AF|nr:CarD family transcriptional regulator [Bacillus sp. HNG]RFB17207.1 CarD family transcriptional regulator [Bacillus sp. HNG]